MFIFIIIVISEPDDVAICEGEGTVFSCVLNKNSNISNNDVHWYRFVRSTGTTEMIDPNGEDVSFLTDTESTLTSNLTITNAMKSHTGYYWVGTPLLNVCNVSLTVLISTYVCVCMCVIYITGFAHTGWQWFRQLCSLKINSCIYACSK